MSSFYDRYVKSLKGNPSAIAKARREQNDLVNGIAFPLADGYKLAKLQTRHDYDKNIESWSDFDILVKHALSKDEKKIATRPYVDLPIGSYLIYDDVAIIVNGQTLSEKEAMPTYKAYVCNQLLRLKGCPYEFPVFSSNTSYSTKGTTNGDLVQLLDTRNKLYLQKNKFTVRLFNHHKDYRIIVGDHETKYYYTITNMDDTASPGVFVVTLKEDEKSHLDKDFYAYNEVEIDFSDLISGGEDNEGGETTPPVAPTIVCNPYQYVAKPFDVICNVPIEKYQLTEGLIFQSLSNDKLEMTLSPEIKGAHKITVEDKYGQQVSKNIIVKE